MKRLIIFENMKLWRAKKFPVILLALVSALIGMIVFNTAQDKAYWDKQSASLGVEKNILQTKRVSIDAQLESVQHSTPEDIETIEHLKDLYRIYQRQYLFNYQQEVMARDYRRGLVSKRERLELWIARDQHLLTVLEAGHDFLNETPTEVRQRLAANQYLLNEDIEPLNSPHEMTATNFLYQLTGYPWILIILIAISLLTMDIFSGDTEGGAYKFLYSQPFSRVKIYAVKYLVYFANSFIVITGVVVLVFGIVTLLNGIGDIAYPSFYFRESYQSLSTVSSSGIAFDSFTFLTWSTYFLRTLPLYFLLCAFVIALIGAASLILSNTANVVNGLFCFLVLDFLSRSIFPSQSIFYVLWPFTAAGMNGVLQGLYKLTTVGYLILLGALTVIILGANLIVLRKRDLSGGIGL